MDAFEKEPWSMIRKRGRDRFLIKSIGLYALCFAVGFVVVDVLLVLLGRSVDSLWQQILQWAGTSVTVGAVMGFYEWKQNEENFRKSGIETKSG